MTSTSQRWISSTGGVVLLTLAVFVLLVAIAQAAQPLTQLQRAHGNAAITYAAAPLTQLQRAHAGAAVTYAPAPLSQLQRAHGSADIAYAAVPLTQLQRAHAGADVTYAAAGPAGGSATFFGRGGRVFARTTPVAASTAALIGGIAVTALLIALVAFLALGSRASRRGELAPVASLVQAPSASPAAQLEDRERKAA